MAGNQRTWQQKGWAMTGRGGAGATFKHTCTSFTLTISKHRVARRGLQQVKWWNMSCSAFFTSKSAKEEGIIMSNLSRKEIDTVLFLLERAIVVHLTVTVKENLQDTHRNLCSGPPSSRKLFKNTISEHGKLKSSCAVAQ